MELAGGPSLSPPDLGGRGRQRESGGDPHGLKQPQGRGTQAEEELRGGGDRRGLSGPGSPSFPFLLPQGSGFRKAAQPSIPELLQQA